MSRRPLVPLLALAALLALPPAVRGLSCFQCSEPTQGLQAGGSVPLPKGGYVWSSEPICSKFDSSNSTFKKDCPQTFDKSCFKTVIGGVVL
ncbi:hypothetical protein FJT64_013688 [Amphibalanus amphitrite]|uniref:Protein sleepless n=1 Tax=Amphibalanus amphitrite TaxID=1232801 RepID=A0A6A4VC58_AMPAM|nr:hypothetical protein FJT64_013688 [Amphibalanus amphitrite]